MKYEGLARTAAYAKKSGSFTPTAFQRIEVWDKMPPSWEAALKSWKAAAPKAQAIRKTDTAHMLPETLTKRVRAAERKAFVEEQKPKRGASR